MNTFQPKDYVLVVGVLVTFILGIANAIATFRSSRRTMFINIVTSERVKWLEKLRQDISSFSGLTRTWCFSSLEGKPQEYEALKEIDRLRHVIRLRLNPKGAHDQKIEKLIEQIPQLTDESQRNALLQALE